MRNEINIYLLELIDRTANLPDILIWSDTKATARQRAYTPFAVTKPADPYRTQDSPYKDDSKTTCEELPSEDYKVIESSDDVKKIEFNNRPYFLCKNRPKPIER